jgi:peptide/nickel transport system substrate-binding protein
MVEGMVGMPRTLNPLLSDSNPVDQELTSLIFDGLLYYDDSGRLAPALARTWQVSDDGLTVTFTLREDVTWHDGEPFTADDVVFSYVFCRTNLPGGAGRARAVAAVTIGSDGPGEVSFTLPEPYSPFLDATTRGIVPAHVLGLACLPSQIAAHDFNRQPVGTGPFMVAAGDNWQRTGRLRLAPNPGFWLQGFSWTA